MGSKTTGINGVRHMTRTFKRKVLAAALAGLLPLGIAQGANHREAPITALDEKADITDVYAFVSYDDPTKVTMILNVDPLLEPSNGPTYFPFDPEIVYELKVDNDHDAVEDLRFQFRFRTEQRRPGLFTVFAGAGNGLPAPPSSPAPVATGRHRGAAGHYCSGRTGFGRTGATPDLFGDHGPRPVAFFSQGSLGARPHRGTHQRRAAHHA